MSDSDEEEFIPLEESDSANIFYWNQYRGPEHDYEPIPTSDLNQLEFDPLLEQNSGNASDSDDNYDLIEESEWANIFHWNQYLTPEDTTQSEYLYESVPTSDNPHEFEHLLDNTSDEEQDSRDYDLYEIWPLFQETNDQMSDSNNVEWGPFVGHGTDVMAKEAITHQGSDREVLSSEHIDSTAQQIFIEPTSTSTLPQEEVEILKESGYYITKDLDQGAYGKLYLALCGPKVEVKVPIEDTEQSEGHEFSDERNCFVKPLDLTGKQCAIKRMLLDNKFYQEIRIGLQLNHLNCVKVYDTIVAKDKYYIVMEYVNGATSLTDYLSQFSQQSGKRLDDSTALLIIKHITLGIQYVHRHNIAHQDLHSGNIMPHFEGEQLIWKIVDFGSAYQQGDEGYKPQVDIHMFIFLMAKIVDKFGVTDGTRNAIKGVLQRIKNPLSKGRPVGGIKQLSDELDSMEQIAIELLQCLPNGEELID